MILPTSNHSPYFSAQGQNLVSLRESAWWAEVAQVHFQGWKTARCRYSRPKTYLQDLLGPVRNQPCITFLPFSRHPSTTRAGSLLSRHSNKNIGLLFVISPWTGLHWIDSPSTESSVKEHHQHIHPRWVNKLMVAEHRVNYGHQMQQQDTKILSTRSCCKDELIAEMSGMEFQPTK